MRTVLIIDDDTLLLEMYKQEYEKIGFSVSTLTNADGDIVQQVLDAKPDVVTIDAIMPGRNGWDALKILKSDPRTNNIPVFIACNQSHPDDIKRSLDLGAADHIVLAHHQPSGIPKSVMEYLKNPKRYKAHGWAETKFSIRKSVLIVLLLVVGTYALLESDNLKPDVYAPPPLVAQETKETEAVIVSAELAEEEPVSGDLHDYDAIYSGEMLKRLKLNFADQDVGYPTGIATPTTLTWSTKKIIEDSPTKKVWVEYPHFVGGAEVQKLNGHIKGVIDAVLAEDIEYAGSDSSVDFTLRYQVIGVQRGVVTLELVIASFTGGGNGSHDVPYVINWDLKTDRLIQSGSEMICEGHSISELEPLTRAQIENDYEWSIAGQSLPALDYLMPYQGGVIVAFKPYTVLWGAAGTVRVFLPPELVKGIVCLP